MSLSPWPDGAAAEVVILDALAVVDEMPCADAEHVYVIARAQRAEMALVSLRAAVRTLAHQWEQSGHGLSSCPGCDALALLKIVATDGEAG